MGPDTFSCGYVCKTVQEEECMKASERYIMKAVEQCKSDVNIPFIYCNNVSIT